MEPAIYLPAESPVGSKVNVRCKVMHIGAKIPNFPYMLMRTDLALTDQERDLGVVVDSS